MITVQPLTIRRKEGLFRGTLGFSDCPAAELEAMQEAFLHPAERHHLREQLVPKVREEFLRSRFLVKQTFATLSTREKPYEICVRHGVFGQPILATEYDHQLGISLSHHRNLAACLLFPEEHPMGIDLEMPQPGQEDHMRSAMTDAERRLHRRMYEDENHFLTRLWTAKEALSKILRTGMMTPFSLFELETIEYAQCYTVGYFRHFVQYKAITFCHAGSLCSLVLPRESQVELAFTSGQ